MNKEELILKYKELKEINDGKKPLVKDFLNYCNIHKRKLDIVFGGNAYSKLQEECGDVPNQLHLIKTPLNQFLVQYGQLIKIKNSIPYIADWTQAGFKPSAEGFCKAHYIKWRDLPKLFIQEFSKNPEWNDVLKIIQNYIESSGQDKTNQKFIEIVTRIHNWTPDRKRIIEEGYKIELRNYLGKYFLIEEELGETNPDLLIDKKFPIEVKKDPTQSEYDRLLGQMLRHNKAHGSAIAVVTSISSEDRYRKFYKLFTEIHEKLNMTAELIKK